MHEVKQVTAIPILKNNDKFKSKLSKDEDESGKRSTKMLKVVARSTTLIPFS